MVEAIGVTGGVTVHVALRRTTALYSEREGIMITCASTRLVISSSLPLANNNHEIVKYAGAGGTGLVNPSCDFFQHKMRGTLRK